MSNITRFQFEQMQARLNRPGTKEDPPPEETLHDQIMKHCDTQWPRWKYVHSRMDKRTRNEKGVPDFVIALPYGKTLYVEAKRRGKKLSPEQRDWHVETAKLGHTVHVVFDLREFLLAVEAALSQPDSTVPVGQPLSKPPACF